MDSVYLLRWPLLVTLHLCVILTRQVKKSQERGKFCNKTGLKINVNEILGFSMVLKKKTLFFNIVEVGFKMY